MRVTTIVLKEKNQTTILRRFIDASVNIESTGGSYHSFVFVSDLNDVKSFGHSFIKSSGMKAVEGYPIAKALITDTQIVNSYDLRAWQKKTFYSENMRDNLALSTIYVYSEFEFPKRFENYCFYKVDAFLNESDSKNMFWNIDFKRDVFIHTTAKRITETTILSN